MGKSSVRPKVVWFVLVHRLSIFRLGLRSILSTIPNYRVVGECSSISQLPIVIGKCKPHVIILCLDSAPCQGENEIILRLKKYFSILLLLLPEGSEILYRDLLGNSSIGGIGWQSVKSKNLLLGINSILRGKHWKAFNLGVPKGRPKTIYDGIIGGFSPLTQRERQTLALVANGLTNKQIGEALYLTEKTVKNYLANVFQKLGVRRRAHAATVYVQHYANLLEEQVS